MAKDYSKKMKQSALIQQTEEYMDNEVFGEQQEQQEQGRVEQPTSFANSLPMGEATKGISVKIPYSLYDALDAIKKQTQRTGNRNDKMGIGDLVILAVKEFVERNHQ